MGGELVGRDDYVEPQMVVYRGQRLLNLINERGGRHDTRELELITSVLPFKVNSYVVDHLIDWSAVPEDPIYQLTFPQPGMLPETALAMLAERSRNEIAQISAVRERLNPHPAGQVKLNRPHHGGQIVSGIQHKYRQTVLVFPAAGQTCHAYCSYCFRWPQFVGRDQQRFSLGDPAVMANYLSGHPEVTDVLFTGGDPLMMSNRRLASWFAPLLDERLSSIENVRIGTKALAYWPYRFLGRQGDDLLRLFEHAGRVGRRVAIMAHFSHPRELDTVPVERAVRRILDAGLVIRVQAPVVRHVNDSAKIWADLWRKSVHMGMSPYYMFVERDTGPSAYFGLPLVNALDVYRKAQSQLSGLGRSARGPVMSADPGKIQVDGTIELAGKRYFVLKLLQARDEKLVGTVFLAEFNEKAQWLDDLKPNSGAWPWG
jgi:L-lysine 2,3-aminomutase